MENRENAAAPALERETTNGVQESHMPARTVAMRDTQGEPYLDWAALAAAPLVREPYKYIVVPDFLRQELFDKVVADFPPVPGPGSHPPSELTIKGHFKAVMDVLRGPQFQGAIEDKFGIDLAGRPTMYTVRGYCREHDGSIHTDSVTKIITVLLYMNTKWDEDGGRLRLLRDGHNIDNYVAEVPPYGGTLLVFQRADNSWHGHLPYAGRRRAIQLNWVTNQQVVDHEQSRHRFSTRMKKIKNFLTTGKMFAA